MPRGLFVRTRRACYLREMLGVPVPTSAVLLVVPDGGVRVLRESCGLCRLYLFGSGARESKPFLIFPIACATILVGALVLAAVYGLAPEYFAPCYAAAGATIVVLFLRSSELTLEQKTAIAIVLMRLRRLMPPCRVAVFVDGRIGRLLLGHPLIGCAEQVGEIDFDVFDGGIVQARIGALERQPEGAKPYRNVHRHLIPAVAIAGWGRGEDA